VSAGDRAPFKSWLTDTFAQTDIPLGELSSQSSSRSAWQVYSVEANNAELRCFVSQLDARICQESFHCPLRANAAQTALSQSGVYITPNLSTPLSDINASYVILSVYAISRRAASRISLRSSLSLRLDIHNACGNLLSRAAYPDPTEPCRG
jgi:hypothetical protein